MSARSPDIVIVGAGIAGLWAFHHFKRKGYDALLLESGGIGGGQTIASQGIIHSGLKYAFAGKINALAQSISAMPDLWRAALKGEGTVDLSSARTNADSQYLLVPGGLMGGLVKLVTKKALGDGVREVPQEEWPDSIKDSGFKGRVIFMDEPVLDVPSVLRALAAPFMDCIRHIDMPDDVHGYLAKHNITPKHIVFTAAQSNHAAAKTLGHDKGLQTQRRPLLMGMVKNAPFPLYAHMVGNTDKPVATITTHKTKDGDLVWYLGGGAAERDKESDPQAVYDAALKAFKKYLPGVDTSRLEWATLPIDRIEGKSDVDGWMPDTPTIHRVDNHFYCWPTKLTFAPLLAERLEDMISTPPSNSASDYSDLPAAGFADAPWDKAIWSTL